MLKPNPASLQLEQGTPREGGKARSRVQPKYMTKGPMWKVPEEGNELPGQRMYQCQEAQRQKFLKTLQLRSWAWGSLPPAEEMPWDEAKAFLSSFEQVAKACWWPEEEWVARLLPALSGEAEQAFWSLEARDREDYGKVKAAILRAEALRAELQRQHFRQFCCQEVKDPRRVYSQVQELCSRWLKPERRSKEQILELLVLEQFLASLPQDLQGWIRGGGPETCSQAVALAEDFLLKRQQEAGSARWQGPLQDVCVGSLEAEGTSPDAAQGQIYEEAKRVKDVEIPLLGGGIKGPSPSISVFPRDGQVKTEAGLGADLLDQRDTGISLHRVEQTISQAGQQTIFWQVLQEEGGNAQLFGEGEATSIKVEASSHAEDEMEERPGAFPLVNQGNGPLTAETYGERTNHPMIMDRVEKNVKKRKYREDYLQYGFTSIIIAGIEKPQCVICGEVLAAESMKPNKLKRHFDCKHSSLAGKDPNYFRSKADGLKKARLDTGGEYHKQNVTAVEASYLVALRIARAMKPHTTAEDLLLPAAKDIVQVMIGDEFVTKLSALPLSNDTVRRRINDLSADILGQVIQEIKSAPLPIFSIQLDESTDVANCSQLLVYVRYINDDDFKDEFLFYKPLETTTTAHDVFDTVGSFLKEHKISWEKVCGVCTDGASAVLGCRSGFQRLVLNESPKVIGSHCMNHWQILTMKTLPQELQEVMKSVISSVNFVKADTLNSQLFLQLCNELDAPNNALLFHTEVRWLSTGKVLKRAFELRDELKMFFNQKARPQYEALFSDESELQKIAYLVDIFTILNELNLSLQGPNATCLNLSEMIQSFQMKLLFWLKKMDENKMYMFPTLSAFFEEHDIEPDKRIKVLISVKEHLRMLADEISLYFPNLPDTPFALARSPFTVRVEDVPETAQKEFIEFINSDAVRTDFSRMPVTKFWIKCLPSYPVLSETVLRLLLPFPTTYLCETGFSSLLVIKSQYRSSLVVEDYLRCALAKTAPRISDLVRKKQSQPSH
uniref:SCAN box domain-containing protein n=1 Tax=Anolis carolinensis TaxID=28377 RepID=A0A803TBK6_ANOCA|nr:PREDICTED: SCAN domain-containing protein 3 isoform X1 [Anolis carolinensis]XP_008103992.1 PREDICTED: SCAN domain-containing protein 3 isoform X1 [Anolis carolinensis]XP_008103993.1 PREDICTED: SCAN domain-containing protein 3 isoform X1 [Anolis carolinensis]XP_008103994.1 PREDICTED: SCAN domain-containing protein 3 isoform X1 [Anolis carolinensis]XP_008103995.1 PREDICTED: SCAN domain-containing protein 3 isoform X1 [Anolis carolinensis]XP_008103997.1 PREDICTED: SCAN domain-containing protei|eukprot:XP_008103991.1 PREDICTED: SCAN domain-containing protein 3 isoform X1 [Anolis carolinensis]